MSSASRRSIGAGALLFAALVLAGCGQSAGSSAGASGSSPDGRNPDELVFAAVPSENAQSLQQDYQPLITLLEKETGKKIRFQSATSYSAVIEAQRTDKVDIVQYGPFSLITAQNSGVKATPIAAQTVKKGATPGYQSYGITRPGSGINSIADYKGKKVCFVDPDSDVGVPVPVGGIAECGDRPEQGHHPGDDRRPRRVCARGPARTV